MPPRLGLRPVLVLPPIAEVAGAPYICIEDTSILLSRLGSTDVYGDYTVTWDPGDGTGLVEDLPSGSAGDLVHTYADPGQFTGYLTITSLTTGLSTSVGFLVTVLSTAAVDHVTVAPTALAGPEGEADTLTASVYNVTDQELLGRYITWTTTDDTVAHLPSIVGPSVLVQYVGEGTADVVAHCEGVASTAVGVTVSAATTTAVDSVVVSPTDVNGLVGESAILTAVVYGPGTAATSLALDTFTDTDGVLLSNHSPDTDGPWTRHTAAAGSTCEIQGNLLAWTSDADAVNYYLADPGTDTYAVEFDLEFVIVVETDEMRLSPWVRMSTGSVSGYSLQVRNNGDYRLMRYDAGTSIALAPLRQLAVTAGTTHTFRLECQGSTLRSLVDGVLIDTVTDATYASGRPGFRAATSTSENVASANMTITLLVLEGATVRVTRTMELDGTETTAANYTFTWTAGEIAAVTDWSALRLEVSGDGSEDSLWLANTRLDWS